MARTPCSFAWHHFQLYDIDISFLFALGAIEWEMHKNRFPIDFDCVISYTPGTVAEEDIFRMAESVEEIT